MITIGVSSVYPYFELMFLFLIWYLQTECPVLLRPGLRPIPDHERSK